MTQQISVVLELDSPTNSEQSEITIDYENSPTGTTKNEGNNEITNAILMGMKGTPRRTNRTPCRTKGVTGNSRQFYLTNRVRVVEQISRTNMGKRCCMWFMSLFLTGFIILILLSTNGII